jgi:hypothetical protein
MEKTIIEEKIRESTPPPQRWRNRYWFAREIKVPVLPSHPGGLYGPGIFVPHFTWPSRDIAETKAKEGLERHHARDYLVYVGAERLT